MPIAITTEQLALRQSIQEWAERAGTPTLVRRMEPSAEPAELAGAAGSAKSAGLAGPDMWAGPAGSAGPDRPDWPAGGEPWVGCWSALAGLGIFSIALPPAVGGDGGSVADLAAALEQLARALVPGPVLPALLAGLISREHMDLPAMKELLPDLAAGRASAAVALTTAAVTGFWLADGTLRVSGETGPVLGGGTTTHLLLGAVTEEREEWFVLPARAPGVEVAGRRPVDFSRSLASVRLADAVIGPGQVLAGQTARRVRDLAATLFAAEAAGVAGWCLSTAVGYARARQQFGRPIGSFQAVKHICAGMLCRAERATALAWDAARAVDEAPDEHPLAAAAAAAVALHAAVDNAKDCVQVLGGIGFTWEHDAHLYLRRALALRQSLGGSAAWRVRAAELALAGGRRHLALDPADVGTGAGISTGTDASTGIRTGAGTGTRTSAGTGTSTEPVALAARSVTARVAALPADQRRGALADAGYAAPHWPAPYGQSASPAELLVIDSELDRAGLSRPDLVIGGWAGPAIIRHGTPAQRERFALPTLRGEITWCQLFSEPEAGSDLAAVRTRAERVEGGWHLTGQKVWTSLAREADWAICLARTDASAPKHRGLTYFLVDMGAGGIEIRPLREITGRAVFNEVFLDQVFVPDDCVVGECGDGWRIARATLATERTAIGRGSALGEEVEALIEAVWAGDLAGDPGAAEQLGALVADGLAGSLLDLRSALAQLGGAGPANRPDVANADVANADVANADAAEADAANQAAVRKLVGVAHRQAVAETALTMCGPEGAASDGPAAAAVDQFLLTRCLSIAGGTTQILLSVVAERALGLPREEVR